MSGPYTYSLTYPPTLQGYCHGGYGWTYRYGHWSIRQRQNYRHAHDIAALERHIREGWRTPKGVLITTMYGLTLAQLRERQDRFAMPEGLEWVNGELVPIPR